MKTNTFAKKVLAEVQYPVIWNNKRGCYVWVTPDSASTLAILGLLQDAPFKTKDGTELHCTVLYSTMKDLPYYADIDFPDDRVWGGDVTWIEHWVDHKGRDILVARIDSKDLSEIHEALKAAGLEHSYPDYNTHMTIAKDIDMCTSTRVWLEETNQRLANTPLHIEFSPELKGSSID